MRAAPFIIGVFACEVAAALLIAVGKSVVLGLGFFGVAISIALTWVRRHRKEADASVGARIEAAKSLLADGSRTAAWNEACAAAYAAAGELRVRAAIAVMARIALEEKDFRLARQILAQATARRLVDPCLEATIEHADGGVDRAIEILKRARARAGAAFDGAAARMLVELYVETNDLTRAVRVAIDHVNLIKDQDLRNMIASLEAWGEREHAVALTLAVALRSSIAARHVRRSEAPDRPAIAGAPTLGPPRPRDR
jgi:hypothetical protein